MVAALGPDRSKLPVAIPGDLVITVEGGESIETGDVGFVEDETRARVLGPKDARWFLRQGIIDVPLIERVCKAHPGVAAATVELTDGEHESVVLTVREQKDIEVPLTPRLIRRYLRLQLPSHDLPSRIEIVQ
jgi:acyl-CoA synthetase (AMP-forming)/AMP-acid ligase II